MWRIFRMEGFGNRVFGLDLLRFIAIFMVLLGHSMMFVPEPIKKVCYKFMLDGVGIFFVLSGFLIGGILIRILNKENAVTFPNLLDFWKRRWMRTLPAYLVVLLFLLVYTAAFHPEKVPDTWYRFFYFGQNLFVQRPSFFAEAWSLSIEEWFYLSVPLILFAVLYFLKTPVKWTVLLCAMAIISLVTYYRAYLFHEYDATLHGDKFKDYIHLSIEYQVVPRLDSIMFGVVGAFLAYYFADFWKSWFKYMLFVCGIALMYFVKYKMGYKYGEFAVVWIPSLKSLAVLCMLPVFSTMKNGLGVWTKWITFFSLISYSLYLVNLNVVSNIMVKQWFNNHYSGKMIVGNDWYISFALFWILTIAISFFMYQCIEVPFMKMRDKNKH